MGTKWVPLTFYEERNSRRTLADRSVPEGNFLLIVMFAGYENFVSKIHIGNHEDRPSWMGSVDFAGLKIKLISSIGAISGIELLRVFLPLGTRAQRWTVNVWVGWWRFISLLPFPVSCWRRWIGSHRGPSSTFPRISIQVRKGVTSRCLRSTKLKP
jgi:Uncharacterized protein family, UPF0114